MADEYYSVPQNPVYDEETIRKIQDNDPVRASTIVNPVLEQMIENTSAVKRQADKSTERLKEIEEQGPGAIFMPDGTPLDKVLDSKADLDPNTGRVKLSQMPDMDAASYYHVFEPEEWDGGELRISKEAHGMAPKQPACVCAIRQRLGRTALEYDEGSALPVAGLFIEAVKAALAANTETPGLYPTAEDGPVLLTWEQMQYLLLESTSSSSIALVSAEEAAAKAVELGFNWRERDTLGVEESVSLDELLSAAYLPALGGPSAAFEVMVTAQALQGLRFRRGIGGEGWAAKYDLDGCFTTTWGTMCCRAYWDMSTQELVVCGGPFAGDLLVMGQADAGGSSAGPLSL